MPHYVVGQVRDQICHHIGYVPWPGEPPQGYCGQDALRPFGINSLRTQTTRLLAASSPAIGTISNISNLSRQHVCVAPSQFGGAVLGLLKAVVEAITSLKNANGEVHERVTQITDLSSSVSKQMGDSIDHSRGLREATEKLQSLSAGYRLGGDWLAGAHQPEPQRAIQTCSHGRQAVALRGDLSRQTGHRAVPLEL